MTLYDYLLENKPVLTTLFRNGVLSSSIVGNMEVYKYYLDLSTESVSQSMRICLTMDRFEKSQRGVYKIIEQMSAEI